MRKAFALILTVPFFLCSMLKLKKNINGRIELSGSDLRAVSLFNGG